MPPADGVDARAHRSTPAARHASAGHPARGARLTRALAALEADGWVTLTTVPRPGGGPVIDHLLVGPAGVVVVSSRSWAGRIEVTRGVVQQNGFWRERETGDVARSAGSVAALLPPRFRSATHAIVCVTQHELPAHVVAPGVHVVGVTLLGQVLRALPRRLAPAEVGALAAQLRTLLLDTAPPEQLTTEHLAVPPAARGHGTAVPVGFAGAGAASTDRLAVPAEPRTLRGAVQDALRPAVRRPAARRGRGDRPGRLGDRRLVLARLLLAVLGALLLVLAGPPVIHGVLHGFGASPVGGPSTPAYPVVPDGATGDLSPAGPAGASPSVADQAPPAPTGPESGPGATPEP